MNPVVDRFSEKSQVPIQPALGLWERLAVDDRIEPHALFEDDSETTYLTFHLPAGMVAARTPDFDLEVEDPESDYVFECDESGALRFSRDDSGAAHFLQGTYCQRIFG